MAHHKKKRGHPVPPGNQPQGGPPLDADVTKSGELGGGAPFEEQDVKRRLGGFQTAGEHSIQQPSPLNDGARHSE